MGGYSNNNNDDNNNWGGAPQPAAGPTRRAAPAPGGPSAARAPSPPPRPCRRRRRRRRPPPPAAAAGRRVGGSAGVSCVGGAVVAGSGAGAGRRAAERCCGGGARGRLGGGEKRVWRTRWAGMQGDGGKAVWEWGIRGLMHCIGFSPSWELHPRGKLNGSIRGRCALGHDGEMSSMALSTQKRTVIGASSANYRACKWSAARRATGNTRLSLPTPLELLRIDCDFCLAKNEAHVLVNLKLNPRTALTLDR